MKKPKRATGWAEQLKYDMEFARFILLKQGHVAPMFVIHAKGGAHVVGVQLGDREDKHRVYGILSIMCAALGATALTFIAEAWIRHSIEDTEDKQEVVIVQTSYRDDAGKHSVFEAREIVRGADGEPCDLIAHSGSDDDTRLEGAVYDILLEEAPTEAQQEIAQNAMEMLQNLGLLPDGMRVH